MSVVVWLVFLIALAEKVWKHLAVVRYFKRAVPRPPATPQFVSILQPILSGDPTLRESLECSLSFESSCRREYIWLVDSDDLEAQRICRELIEGHPESQVQLVLAAPPGERENPKMVKLIAGAKLARGQVIVVLDDDTRLPDGGLEQCLPFLDQPGIGIAFGLPYYVSFHNGWSSLIGYFVNSHSLLTYIPYLQLTKPFTINGMFYALNREVLEAIGGFDGLEGALADDFAMAQRVRAHGYELAQTPLRHAISTHVTGFQHYLSLMHRWMIFPRESLMRHLAPRDGLLIYGLNFAPALFPLAVLLLQLVRPSAYVAAFGALYFGYSYVVFSHLNARYLHGASPWRGSWLVPVIQILFPIQLLTALVSPQRIRWRGHLMKVEPGGGFRFIRRRAESDGALQWRSDPDERSSR
jgi:ceramide glucosyltransferase